MSASGRYRTATRRKPSGRTRSCRVWIFQTPGQTREARGFWSPARCCSEARGARPRCFARGTRRPARSSRRFSCRGRPPDSPSRTQRQDGSTSPWRCGWPTQWKSWLLHFRSRRHHPAAEDGRGQRREGSHRVTRGQSRERSDARSAGVTLGSCVVRGVSGGTAGGEEPGHLRRRRRRRQRPVVGHRRQANRSSSIPGTAALPPSATPIASWQPSRPPESLRSII